VGPLCPDYAPFVHQFVQNDSINKHIARARKRAQRAIFWEKNRLCRWREVFDRRSWRND